MWFIQKVLRVLSQEGFSSLMRKAFMDVWYFLSMPYWLIRLKGYTLKTRSLDDLVDFVGEEHKRLVRCMQTPGEILALLKLVKDRKVKTILEIGTNNGGTLFLWSRVLSHDGTLVSVDLPRGRWGGGYYSYRIPLYKSFATKEQSIFLLREDSHALSTYKAVETALSGRKVDFFFVDGDHSYEGVKADFEMYKPLLAANALVAFHDTNVGGDDCKVPEYWADVKKDYPFKDIGDGTGLGIGVIYL